MLDGPAAPDLLAAGEGRPRDQRTCFHAACVSGFAECSSFLQLQAAASKVSARFLPFSPRLSEINFAESLAKMSGWFSGGRGGGKELAATSLPAPPPFHLSFGLFVVLLLSRSPFFLS